MIDFTDEHIRVKFDAFIGNYMSFYSYLNSYENAFNALIKHVYDSGGHVDSLSYPILFTARHALELGFKANIRYFSKYSERNAYTNSDSHNLKDLFNGFKIQVNEAIKTLKEKYDVEVDNEDILDFNNYCKSVDDLVERFDLLDKGSFSFRYPLDKNNMRVFQPGDKVNILDIKELFDNAMILLYHTSDLFTDYTDYADYIEKYYEDELKSEYGIFG